MILLSNEKTIDKVISKIKIPVTFIRTEHFLVMSLAFSGSASPKVFPASKRSHFPFFHLKAIRNNNPANKIPPIAM